MPASSNIVNQTISVPESYFNHFRELLQEHGIDLKDMLTDRGLPATELGDAEMSLSQLKAILFEAIELTGEPAFGFYLGNRMPATTHGMMGYAAISGQNLEQAISAIAKYIETTNMFFSIDFHIDDDTAVLQINDNCMFGRARYIFHETFLGVFNNIIKVVVDQSFAIAELRLGYPAPEHADMYKSFLDCDPVFDCIYTQIHLPVKLLSLPLLFADKKSHELASRQCEELLCQLKRSERFHETVRVLLRAKKGLYPNAEVVAAELNITPRTLRRRLLNEGASFHNIINDIKRIDAVELLQASSFSVTEIAYFLGYSNLANFSRAFKKTTGISPAAYRKKNAD